MIYLWITLLILAVFAFWILNLFGMPGNWLIVLLAFVWWLFGSQSEPFVIGWILPLTLVVLATIGELLEFGASVVGTNRLGGSRYGAIASLVGSIVGGILGAIVGLPIPFVGWIIGSVFFACVGAMLGATLGEKWSGKPIKSSLKIGGAAFVGRMLGTVSKITIGSVMAIVTILGLFL